MKPRLKLKPKAPQSRFPKRRSPLYRTELLVEFTGEEEA